MKYRLQESRTYLRAGIFSCEHGLGHGWKFPAGGSFPHQQLHPLCENGAWEVLGGDAHWILAVAGHLVHQQGMVLERLNPSLQPAKYQVVAAEPFLHQELNPPRGFDAGLRKGLERRLPAGNRSRSPRRKKGSPAIPGTVRFFE